MSALAALPAYRRILVAGFRQQSTYRMAALAGLVTNTVFGFLKAAVLLATVRSAGGMIGGYTALQMSAYVWWSQAMLGSVSLWGRTPLSSRIRSGDVVVDLVRPIDLQASTLLTEIGNRLFPLFPRGLPMVAIGALVVGMAPPQDALAAALAPLSFLLAVAVSAALGYAVSLAGFWLVETRGVEMAYMVASTFLAGLNVPLNLFPSWLRTIAEWTPFPSMLMNFTRVAGGGVPGSRALLLIAGQGAWLAGLLVLGAVLTVRGRRRLEVQGG